MGQHWRRLLLNRLNCRVPHGRNRLGLKRLHWLYRCGLWLYRLCGLLCH